MTTEKGNKRLIGFIPHRFEDKERPELADFPLNVFFANFYNENGSDMTAHALYVPDFLTYKEEGKIKSVRYTNIYEPNHTLLIVRQEEKWSGIKVINNNVSLFAEGPTWEIFFTHLTSQGLSKGERCKFEKLPLSRPSGKN